MDPKRIPLLFSPVEKIHKSIKVYIHKSPITWGFVKDIPMHQDGCAIARPEFFDSLETGSKYQFQFRIFENGFLAKGTIRKPIPGLTTWEEWCHHVGISDDVDIIMDPSICKSGHEGFININSIGIHKIDDHDSKFSLLGWQAARFGKLPPPSKKEVSLVKDYLAGDRTAIIKMLRLDDDNPFKSKLERVIGGGLPITNMDWEKLDNFYLSKYIFRLFSRRVSGGSRFLFTDPKIGYKQIIVPTGYLKEKRDHKDVHYWISTPIVSKECIVPIDNVIEVDGINSIGVDAHTIAMGKRDCDGDLTKIITIRR